MNELPIDELRGKIREGKLDCQQCVELVASDVHHLDGDHSNNTPSNLVPWCKRCHNEYMAKMKLEVVSHD